MLLPSWGNRIANGAKLSLIGADLGNPAAQTWIVNAMSLVQAVLGPLIASASDVFQVRKPILVASCLLALIGSGIAPGSTNIYRLIGAQALLGVGLSAVPLSYVVPSEILPRRWRPSKKLLLLFNFYFFSLILTVVVQWLKRERPSSQPSRP